MASVSPTQAPAPVGWPAVTAYPWTLERERPGHSQGAAQPGGKGHRVTRVHQGPPGVFPKAGGLTLGLPQGAFWRR